MQMQEPQAKKRKQARKEAARELSDIHAEAYAGNLSRLGSLYLEHKAKSQRDPLDSLERSPLHYACLAGNIDCIRYLIDQGSDMNLKDVNGQTPISLGLLHNCSPSFNKFVAELITADEDYPSVVTCQNEVESRRSFLVRVGRKRKNPSEENESLDPPFILDLPTEMTCSIFSFNDASMFFIARLVCKKWYGIFCNESVNIWPYVQHVKTKSLDPFFRGQTLVNALNQLTTKLVSLEFRGILPVSTQAEFTNLTKLTNLVKLSYDSSYIHRKLFDVSSTYLLAKPFVPYTQIRSLDFRSFCDFMNFDQIELCTGLKELYLSSTHLSRWGTTQSFELTLMKLTQIEKLALSIDDPLILKDYTSLKELDMKVYQVLDGTEYQFVLEGLLDVLKNNSSLELLRLSIFKYWRSSKGTSKFVKTLPTVCRNLKVLECDQFLVGSDTDFANIAVACPNLEVLAVDVSSRSSQFWKKSKIGDATLISIAKNCPNFRRLCAAKCQVTDKGVQTMIDECVALEALVFSSNTVRQLTFENKSKLEYVKLPACAALSSLRVVQCPRLGDLHISDCNLLTELHLEQCSRPLMLTLNCASSLNVVRMTDVSLYDVSGVACYQFENVVIESKGVINNLEFPYCHQLKSVTCMAPLQNLNLDGCQQLQQLDIAKNYLESLHLSECHQLSDDQIFRLLKGSNGSLRVIDLRYNNKLSAATVRAFATYAPSVKELMLSYCYYVSEEALLHVLTNCKSLVQLIIGGLQSVTDRVVEAAKNHPTLTMLNVSSCPNVSLSYKKTPRNSKLSIIL